MFQIRKISYDYVGGSLFIIATYTFNDQKVAVKGSILAISAMATK